MPSMSNISLALLFLGALLLAWRWTRSHPEFDLADLITEKGKVSSTKLWKTGGWVVFTWGFVTLIQQGKMTEFYYIGYGSICFGVGFARDFYGKKDVKE